MKRQSMQPMPGAHRGFVLLLTVMMLSGMMLLLVGMMSLQVLDRKAARSYSDIARAEMALESGLADAMAALGPIAERDDSLVFRLDDPEKLLELPSKSAWPQEHFFTFGAYFTINQQCWKVKPLVSGAREMDGGAGVLDGFSLLREMPLDNLTPIVALTPYDRYVPQATWVEVPSLGKQDALHFAWWVEDLSGRLDAKRAATLPRNESKSPEEIQYFTLFDAQATTKPHDSPQDRLVAQRDLLRTPASIRSLLREEDAARAEPYLTYQLSSHQRRQTLIPHGFGYVDAGRPAPNLSEWIQQGNVDAIAAHIDRNLPQFRHRGGGFPATDHYSKTIAASIIDYADADSDATVGRGFRGVDSYPFVNELYDRYEWVHVDREKRVLTIRVTTFVELWNLTQQSIQGRIQFTNINRHGIVIPLVGMQSFDSVTYPEQWVSLPANGFLVCQVGTHDYHFPMGLFEPSELLFPAVDTTESRFELRWNGRLVDTARGGLQRTSGTLRAGPSQRKWKGNASPAHDHNIGQHGDPRASYYINTWVYANDYDENSNWGGRALKRGIAANRSYREVSLEKWPDRGWNSSPGRKAPSDAILPTSLLLPAHQPNMAPACIANRPLQSLAEMGHIFDPAQWRQVESARGVGDARAGGGMTLAIGRPEYAAFDRPGMRAAQLLDLFALAPTPQDELPRVNINTAPREVLRCLVAGQELNGDPQLGPIFAPTYDSVGDRFADAVIATRNKFPLRSLSDLQLIRINPVAPRNDSMPQADTEPFFGSRFQYPSATQPADSWDDAGREELFQRVSSLVTFQSKTFRIVVAGQVINQTGVVIAKKAREYVIEIAPARDAQGAIVANKPMQIRRLLQRDW